MRFDIARLNELAGLEKNDLLVESSDTGAESDETDECDTGPMTEARLRKIISRELRSALEELRKSAGQPMRQIRRKSRLI